ncbi:TPA: hypothetical protein QDB48_000913 [Burkholderia vietnamiensis]|nr:hypothetical protein [Burkholderia vietnamiensis]
MTTTDNSRADALTDQAIPREVFYRALRAALKRYRSDHPSRYLNDDQVDADDAEFASRLADDHAKIIAAPPIEQSAAAPIDGCPDHGSTYWSWSASTPSPDGYKCRLCGWWPDAPAPSPADERASWGRAREPLAVAMAGFASRSGSRDFNAALSVLDAITEPGLPLSWLRSAPVSAAETGAEGADALAHEVWSAAQRAPGEGIEDAVQRIAAILSRSPAMAAEAVAIRAGWKLVPVEPTAEMLAAAENAGVTDGEGLFYPFRADEIGAAYCAMLAAAPQPAQAILHGGGHADSHA